MSLQSFVPSYYSTKAMKAPRVAAKHLIMLSSVTTSSGVHKAKPSNLCIVISRNFPLHITPLPVKTAPALTASIPSLTALHC